MDQKASTELSKLPQQLVTDLFPVKNLPLEVIDLILLNLLIEEVERLGAINKAWLALTQALCLDFYREAFQKSTLWKYVPKYPTYKNVLLRPYFDEFLDNSWSTKLCDTKCIDLETISKSFSEIVLDDLLIGVDRTILLTEEEYLINERQASKANTIIEFLAEPPTHWLKVAKSYRHIETTLNLLLLGHFIFNDKTSFTESLFLILDTRLTRWLTGTGLEELNRRTLEETPLLISHLIDFALGEGKLYLTSDPEKRPTYQENAKDLLSRLTDDNCWSLLSKNNQGSVLVSAIKRQCFPIIDSFGDRALRGAMEENPDDEMLLVLLNRFGAERLSKILPSLGIEENFEKIVSNCSQFMGQLLSQLTLEQLCDMASLLTRTRFFYLVNGSIFLAFLKILPIESAPKEIFSEKVIVSVSSKAVFTTLKIICDPRTFLLGLAKLKPSFPDQIIKSQCIDYLLPRDILIFLKEYPALWDILPVDILDKFTAPELLVLAAINIKAVSCIVERGYLNSRFTDLKDFVEFLLRYIGRLSKPLQDKCTEVANAHYNTWDYTPGKECTYTYIHWYILFHPVLLDVITNDWLNQLRKQCQPDIHVALLQKISDIQDIKNTKKQLADSKKSEDPISVIDVAPSDIPVANTSSVLPSSMQDVPVIEPKKPQETQCEINKSLPVQQNEPLHAHDSLKIPFMPEKHDSTNDVWKKWLLYGFLFLAGAGLFLSFLGLLEVSFALKACEVMINLLVECTPETAALTIFITSALIGLVTVVSAQVDNCINQDKFSIEETNSDDTCSWNEICGDSEKNTQKSTPVFVVKTTAPFKALIDPTSKATSAENSANIFCC